MYTFCAIYQVQGHKSGDLVGKPYKTHTKLSRIRAEKEIVLVDVSKKHNLHSFY